MEGDAVPTRKRGLECAYSIIKILVPQKLLIEGVDVNFKSEGGRKDVQ